MTYSTEFEITEEERVAVSDLAKELTNTVSGKSVLVAVRALEIVLQAVEGSAGDRACRLTVEHDDTYNRAKKEEA